MLSNRNRNTSKNKNKHKNIFLLILEVFVLNFFMYLYLISTLFRIVLIVSFFFSRLLHPSFKIFSLIMHPTRPLCPAPSAFAPHPPHPLCYFYDRSVLILLPNPPTQCTSSLYQTLAFLPNLSSALD